MPQQKEIRWSQLKVGILTLASLAVLAAAIFLISGQTGFFASTMLIRTYLRDAAGLKNGAPVRLAGVDVGNVTQVNFTGSPELSRSIEIVMEINRRYEANLRGDSEASLAAEGLLGQRYINISPGRPESPPVGPDGIIPFRETAEFSELVGGSRDLLDNLNVLTAKLNAIIEAVESGEGSIGKLIYDDSFYRRLDAIARSGERLFTNVTSGQGTLGRLLSSEELYDRAHTAVAKLEDVLTKIESGEGTLSKLIHDPSLYQNADQLVARASLLMGNINQGEGTLGKLVKEEELYQRMNSAVAGLDAVLTGMRNGEGTVGRLLHDPSLYSNLNSTSEEVRTLIADFQRNPKKFLTIQFKIF